MAKTLIKLTVIPAMGLPNDKTVYAFIEYKNGDTFCERSDSSEKGLKVTMKKQISDVDIASIYDSLAKVTIKAFPEHNEIFMDGNYIKLEVGSDNKKISCEWHCEPPKGWEQLSDITKQLEQFFCES